MYIMLREVSWTSLIKKSLKHGSWFILGHLRPIGACFIGQKCIKFWGAVKYVILDWNIKNKNRGHFLPILYSDFLRWWRRLISLLRMKSPASGKKRKDENLLILQCFKIDQTTHNSSTNCGTILHSEQAAVVYFPLTTDFNFQSGNSSPFCGISLCAF